jgi:hypothetical protein
VSNDVSAFSVPQLRDLLYAKAKGSLREEAAIGLLDAHGTWLRRDSLRKYITLSNPDHGPVVARIEWEALAFHQDVLGSDSEVAILWFAIALVRDQAKVSIGDLISSMDVVALGLCMNAMAHARGWHERGYQATVPGRFPGAEPRRFEVGRSAAYRLLGDAVDWVTGDHEPPLTREQKDDVASFREHVGHAKDALNRAAAH